MCAVEAVAVHLVRGIPAKSEDPLLHHLFMDTVHALVQKSMRTGKLLL